MTRSTRLLLLVLVGAGSTLPCSAAPLPAAEQAAQPQPRATDAAPVLVTAQQWREMASAGARLPVFTREQARAEASVRAAIRAGVDVPVPSDPGGGASHEQHKRNYQAIQAAGALYRLTGDRAYADYVRDVLLAYARLYPTLGAHPAGRGQVPGRLFWQSLNDSVWLVYASQGYDAIRDTLSAQDRATIDRDVFARMAHFLCDESADNFDKIHNHATWAVAAVGMTGYVLRDQALVDKALRGSRRDGKAGFLAQVDQLFSPDGYYAEGPYYQRYALAPFVLFANAIERNQPQQHIFQRRDGVLLKAVNSLVQSSYGGYFFPINDAILDKGLDTEELVAGIGIAYAQTHDAQLLSIAQRQRRVLLTPEGLAVATALAQGRAQPFAFGSVLLRDGAQGDQGALAILRSGGEDGQTLVMKNTSQGMGHGHFDKLNWLFYDNGQRVVTDYGAARFLNVEAKAGGIYLPENTSWAKQTVAHNTLVVNETSHFNGDWKVGEQHAPTQLLFASTADTQIVSARMQQAYDGVSFTRTQALLSHPQLRLPVVVDLLRVNASAPARYDLPLHFNGQIMQVGFKAERALTQRPVLGKANGYQHLWVDASSDASTDTRSLSWLLAGRFYSYRFGSSAPARALLVESGANDPNFNLRREPALIQRVDGQADVSFFGVLEPHGEYNGTAEYVRGANSRIRAIERVRGDDAEVIVLTLVGGQRIALAVADDADAQRSHQVQAAGQRYNWRGGYARFDRTAGAQ
ncbi:alginate lyase family protein [Xanthomonas arboricola pv. juglandis]|uniref:oligoalginate lyase n=1 Tax=Xanthomonas arboricola TaxID=56448 RepID=UPI000CEECE95|nr:oligoalginate lyase [Xanthomonas arboricola]PPT67236.1 alginate lyase [Xanthomonas arboricola]CAG2086640.1 alginate lyase family protein [Xanthomonas arboricola pv. juglandis]